MERGGDFQLLGAEAGSACPYVAGLCLGTTQPEYTGAPECEVDYQNVATNRCDLSRQCTQSFVVEDNASAATRRWEYAWCELDPESSWRCGCDNYNAPMSVELPTDQAAGDVCPTALDVCSRGAAVEDAPRECTFSYQSASSDWCNSEYECSRALLLGEITVRVSDYMSTSCYPLSDGQWQCECRVSGEQISSFVVESEESWATCTLASTRCADMLASEG
jgi:hypothetical protein